MLKLLGRQRIVFSVALQTMELDVALFLTPDLTGVGTQMVQS